MPYGTTETYTATILSGASISTTLPLQMRQVVGIQMPAAWTAAGLSFTASADGSTFSTLVDPYGVEIVLTVAASQFILIPPDSLGGMVALRLRSGTSAAAVNQGADRAITVVARPFS